VVGLTISHVASHSRILSMQRVGDLRNKRAIGFSGKDAVRETGFIVNNKEIVNRAEDVIEA